jgi:hypothetical protein
VECLSRALRQFGVAGCNNDWKVWPIAAYRFREFGTGHAGHRLVGNEEIDVTLLADERLGFRRARAEKTV